MKTVYRDYSQCRCYPDWDPLKRQQNLGLLPSFISAARPSVGDCSFSSSGIKARIRTQGQWVAYRPVTFTKHGSLDPACRFNQSTMNRRNPSAMILRGAFCLMGSSLAPRNRSRASSASVSRRGDQSQPVSLEGFILDLAHERPGGQVDARSRPVCRFNPSN